MKSLFARLAVASTVVVSLSAIQVKALTIYTLSPGTSVAALSSSYPVGGTLLATTTSPFSAGVISGTLITSVLTGDAANPYAGGLTFTYQLGISSSSPDGSSEMTVSSFSSFLTDVSYNTVDSDVNPSNFSRSSGSGDTVRFIFLNQPVGAGQTSALLVVQTDAVDFQATMAGIIDGLTVNAASLAPIAVPEPASGALILLGLGAMGLRLRRSK
jgi:PEP-CTERM motif